MRPVLARVELEGRPWRQDVPIDRDSRQRRRVEAVAGKRPPPAARAADRIRIRREAAFGQQRCLQPRRRGVAAVQTFGHAADIGDKPAGARRRDADGVGHARRIQPQHQGAGRGAANRANHPRRMEQQLARFELARRQAHPGLGVDTKGKRR